jgi:hypothetical protein
MNGARGAARPCQNVAIEIAAFARRAVRATRTAVVGRVAVITQPTGVGQAARRAEATLPAVRIEGAIAGQAHVGGRVRGRGAALARSPAAIAVREARVVRALGRAGHARGRKAAAVLACGAVRIGAATAGSSRLVGAAGIQRARPAWLRAHRAGRAVARRDARARARTALCERADRRGVAGEKDDAEPGCSAHGLAHRGRIPPQPRILAPVRVAHRPRRNTAVLMASRAM